MHTETTHQSTPGAVLKVHGLHAHYGESHILHGIGFEVFAGEVVTLLGRNGAGRTTTLKSIVGLVKPESGSVTLMGTELVGLAPDARVLGVTVSRHVPTLPRLSLTLMREGPGLRLRIGLDDPIGRKLVAPLTAPAPLDLEAAAGLLARFEGREVLPSPTTSGHRALLELLVRFGRAGVVLADTLIQAELTPVVPDATNQAWIVIGARLAVRGIDAA